jgi:carbon monoxide dehydrogenase subunit G
MNLKHVIDIDQAPERVFSWLDDPERAMKWMSSVSKTEILHRTSDLIGTTFRETVRDSSGATELHGVVTACSPPRLMSFHLEGQFNDVDVEYCLETVKNRTRLNVRATIRTGQKASRRRSIT